MNFGAHSSMPERRYTLKQQQISSHAGGHAVGSAVAGSGRTETLIAGVQHLLREVQPTHIAVVIFNRGSRKLFQGCFEE
jgi:DNA helicase-2/ATP-dependent DNA helicase PcrA